jgi:streptomycin 6-kinase
LHPPDSGGDNWTGEDISVPPLAIPANLRDPKDPEHRDWVDALPAVVEGLAAQWSLRVGLPFEPGGTASWVAPARDGAGRELVLKIGWRHPEAEHEADGLARYAGDGAVMVYAAQSFGSNNALLLERCQPGTALRDILTEPDQDEVVAALLRRLWAAVPDGGPFRDLDIMCAQWADSFDDRDAADQPLVDADTADTAVGVDAKSGAGAKAGAGTRVDFGLLRAGVALWRELPRTADRRVLLATDLHAGNILAARRERWLVIDPKPYVGDPTYDVLQHLLNCSERLRADPLGLVRRLAGLLDLDPARLAQWLFARTAVESVDNPDLYQVAKVLARSVAPL